MKNLKGGRPKLAESEKRIHAFTVRFTESELATLEESSGTFPTREYIRNAALKKRLPTAGTKKIDPALLNELRRIGANINQLSKQANKRRGVEDSELRVVRDKMVELSEILKMVFVNGK